ncbi:hypothetical protein RRSWK_05212 [Rhodopirellula sp. SWK7]|nr:hypothetical protein RRSWK_05212 [Rhodopirellula sp. SWK7]
MARKTFIRKQRADIAIEAYLDVIALFVRWLLVRNTWIHEQTEQNNG